MFTVSEIVLYLCFSVVTGGLILQMVPTNLKPTTFLPKKVLLWSVAGIGILSFMPVLRIILYFISDPKLSSYDLISSILFSFDIGQAWWVTLGLSIVLFFLIFKTIRSSVIPEMLPIKLVLVFGLIVTLGWSSHASSYYQWAGFLAHTLHFLAISVWLGILIVIGWFSSESEKWLSFLRWFHPLAIICVLITTCAGIVLTLYISPDYVNGWILSYGQALLIKHLLFIPLFLFGIINGFLVKKRLQTEPGYNPIGWFRAESIFVMVIFSVTAFMGQQDPPHDVAQTLRMAEPSPLFSYLYQGTLDLNPSLYLSFNGTSFLLFGCSTLFALMMVLAFQKKMSPSVSVIMGLLFSVTGYLSLMLAVQ